MFYHAFGIHFSPRLVEVDFTGVGSFVVLFVLCLFVWLCSFLVGGVAEAHTVWVVKLRADFAKALLSLIRGLVAIYKVSDSPKEA